MRTRRPWHRPENRNNGRVVKILRRGLCIGTKAKGNVCFWHLTDVGRRTIDVRFRGKADMACCTASDKPSFKNVETGVHLEKLSFQLQKSPTLDFAEKCEILPTFQRPFSSWECGSSNPPALVRQLCVALLEPLGNVGYVQQADVP
jgi:hypothetical protein